MALNILRALRDLLGLDHQPYLPASSGPFRCDHCEYYAAAGRCKNPNIVHLRGAIEPGLAQVDPGGCSDWFEQRHG